VTIRNTTQYGAQLTSLGDGSDASFWRLNTVWSSGVAGDTNTSIGTTYTSIQSLNNTGGTGYGVAGGFTNYLVFWSFGAGNTAPSTSSYIDVQLGYNSSTPAFGPGRTGYFTTAGGNFYSGCFPLTTADIQPFILYLFVKTESGTFNASFGSITVIGIN